MNILIEEWMDENISSILREIKEKEINLYIKDDIVYKQNKGKYNIINLRNLNKKEWNNTICYDWTGSIGKEISFVYENNLYTAKILDVIKEKIKILFNDKELITYRSDFKEGDLYFIKRIPKFKIGDIVANSKILDIKKTPKGFKYTLRCLEFNLNWTSSQFRLLKLKQSPYSSGKIVVEENSLWSLKPYIQPFIVNIEEAKSIRPHSNKKIKIKCPNCKFEELRVPNDLKETFRCKMCSTDQSYPEKLMFAILKLNNIHFQTQKTFDDCRNIRPLPFDFYLPNHNILIEMQGEQHYGNRYNDYKLEDTIRNDNIKKEYAKLKKIKLIHIDCKKSEYEVIVKNILNNNDLSFLTIHKSKVKEEVAKLGISLQYPVEQIYGMYCMGMSTTKIAKFYGYDVGTIIKILKRAGKYKKRERGYKLNKIDLENMLYTYKGTVLSVTDGDTLKIKVENGFHITQTHIFRLKGIDTPEKGELNFKNAKDFVIEKVLNKEVYIRSYKSDSFGRWLAEIWYDNGNEYVLLNYELFRAGLLKPESKWNTFKEEN